MLVCWSELAVIVCVARMSHEDWSMLLGPKQGLAAHHLCAGGKVVLIILWWRAVEGAQYAIRRRP